MRQRSGWLVYLGALVRLRRRVCVGCIVERLHWGAPTPRFS